MVKHSQDFPGMALRCVIICSRLGIILFSCCLLMTSCGGDDPRDIIDDFIQTPDTEPIRATIKTAVPLAHIAAVAMEAANGNPSSEVFASTTCSSYPCVSLVSMELDQNSLPFTCEGGGNVAVVGLWTSRDSAILTVSFYDDYAGVSTFPVSRISTFPVAKSSDSQGGYLIVYSDIDVNIDTDSEPEGLSEDEIQDEYDRLDVETSTDAEVNVSLDAWVVEVFGADTPNDYTDDSYSISGGGEYIGVAANSTSSSTNIMQLGLANVLASDDCSSNPTEGIAVINEVAVSTGDQESIPVVASVLMEFDPSCDGEVQVIVATGNYMASNGDSIPIDLNEP